MRRAFQMITFLSCSVILMEQDVSAQTPAFPPVQDLSLVEPETVAVSDQPSPDVALIYSAMGQSCETVLNVQPADAGMIRVDVQAPCLGGQRVDLHWADLSASYLTSVTGALRLNLPVFERETLVQMRMPDGTMQQALVTHGTAAEFTGVGVSWRGNIGVVFHVIENGGDFGTTGHRHAESPIGIAAGQVVTLGDPRILQGFFSQIYSVPKNQGPSVSRPFIEVLVNEVNCGTMQAMTLHQPALNGPWQAMPFEISVPACEKTGQSVMLGSPLRDLVLAEE